MANWRDEAEVVEAKPSWRDEAEAVEQPAKKSGLEVIQQAKPKEVKQGGFGEQSDAAGVSLLDNLSLVGIPNILAAQDAYLPSMPWQEKVEVPAGMSRWEFFKQQKEGYKKGQQAFEDRNRLGTNIGAGLSLFAGPGAANGAKAVVQGAAKNFPKLRGVLTAAPMGIDKVAAANAGEAALSTALRGIETAVDGTEEEKQQLAQRAMQNAALSGALANVANAVGKDMGKAGAKATQWAENTVPWALGMSRGDLADIGVDAMKRANRVITHGSMDPANPWDKPKKGLIKGGANPETQAEILRSFKTQEGNKLGEVIKARDAIYDVPGNDMAYQVEQNLLGQAKELRKLNPGFTAPSDTVRRIAGDMRSPAVIDAITPVAPGSVPGMQRDPISGQMVPRDRAYDVSMRTAQNWANNQSNRMPDGRIKPGSYASMMRDARGNILKPFRAEMEVNMPHEAAIAAEANANMEGVNNYLDAALARSARNSVPTGGLVNFDSPFKQTITQNAWSRAGSATHAALRNTGNALTTRSQKVAQLVAENPAALGTLYPALAKALQRDREKGNQNNEELNSAIFLLKDRLPSDDKLDQLLDDRSRQ